MDKFKIRDKILEIIKQDHPRDSWPIDFEKAPFWVDGRRNSYVRLTKAGRAAFQTAQIKEYIIRFEEPYQLLLINNTLDLQRYIKTPFYIAQYRENDPMFISVFDERLATELTLFGGDLRKYVVAKSKKPLDTRIRFQYNSDTL